MCSGPWYASGGQALFVRVVRRSRRPSWRRKMSCRRPRSQPVGSPCFVDKAKHSQDSTDKVESHEAGRGHTSSTEMPAHTDVGRVRGASTLVIFWVSVIRIATAEPWG